MERAEQDPRSKDHQSIVVTIIKPYLVQNKYLYVYVYVLSMSINLQTIK